MWRRKPSSGASSSAPAGAPASAGQASADQTGRRPPSEPISLTIDALGRKCPIPIIMLADQISQIPTGSVVSVLADDPAAFTDIPAWCRLKSHEHVSSLDLPEGGWSIQVRRKY
ncbi:sulfurtransferase TusA family protein [Streptosporangiaceae bacterium NEAU-GS5]|nr:sulfurtransferase TusA family protein [Streptosporangiaceae bacterium NEAU-GS5]